MFSRILLFSHFLRIKIPVKISFCFPIYTNNQVTVDWRLFGPGRALILTWTVIMKKKQTPKQMPFLWNRLKHNAPIIQSMRYYPPYHHLCVILNQQRVFNCESMQKYLRSKVKDN